MFRKKTVIVVGAGASAEVGLPIGNELRIRIAKILDFENDWAGYVNRGDEVVFFALKNISTQARGLSFKEDLNSYLLAASKIRGAMPQAISIDNFIDAHQGDTKLEKCGKLAIVRSILDAEQNSRLYINEGEGVRRLNFASIEHTWYNAFLQLLTENCRVEDIAPRLDSIIFVIFNYDRCVEHFLYHALQNYYSITADVAAELVGRVRFYHPYGTVGSLPWVGAGDPIDYGGSPSPEKLVTLADQIKTFTEGTSKTSEITAIHDAMREAEIVLFLGFAFHRLNLGLITASDGKHLHRDTQYFGTAFGMSDWNVNVLQRELMEIGSLHPSKSELRTDLKCYALFHEYWRSLALS